QQPGPGYYSRYYLKPWEVSALEYGGRSPDPRRKNLSHASESSCSWELLPRRVIRLLVLYSPWELNHGDAAGFSHGGGASSSSCWGKNGAWSKLRDEPFLARKDEGIMLIANVTAAPSICTRYIYSRQDQKGS
ncbi:hypothetical protein ZWY2020_031040, partial [Hordeum vulgare]